MAAATILVPTPPNHSYRSPLEDCVRDVKRRQARDAIRVHLDPYCSAERREIAVAALSSRGGRPSDEILAVLLAAPRARRALSR